MSVEQEQEDKKKRKKSFWIGVMTTVAALVLIIGLTYAWFVQQSDMATLVTIEAPSAIAIGGPNGETLASVDLSYTDDNVTVDENGNRKITIQRVISVMSGDDQNQGYAEQKLEIVHTTNLKGLTFQLYETNSGNATVDENGSTFRYNSSSPIEGKYINQGSGTETEYRYADDSKHSTNYQTEDKVQIHAEPLYWISEPLTATKKAGSNNEYLTNYVIQVSWVEEENTTAKETDIFYILAQNA